MSSFYVPGSISSSYVSSKRTKDYEGGTSETPYYEGALNQVGIEKQAALQDLSKEYETTIENAYNSYLANQRQIMGSQMGQGFKEQYLAAQEQALQEQVAETNENAASVRQQLAESEASAQSTLQEQFNTEVANMDKLSASMENYLTYLKSLSKDGQSYLSNEITTDQLEDMIANDQIQPQAYSDIEGAAGQSYLSWIRNQLSDSDADWSQWLYGGGWQNYLSGIRSRTSIDGETKLSNMEASDKAYTDTITEAAKSRNKSIIGSGTLSEDATKVTTPDRTEYTVQEQLSPISELVYQIKDTNANKNIQSGDIFTFNYDYGLGTRKVNILYQNGKYYLLK